MAVLGIDAGGSSTRWLLLDREGNELARGKTDAITGHIFTPESRALMFERLHKMLIDVSNTAKPDAIVAGMTGVAQGNKASEIFQQEISEALHIDVRRVEVYDDMQIAYRSAFELGEGVLVYAGTGSVGYHIRKDGEVIRAGGYGRMVDDAGGGYWIGYTAMRQVMRWKDETGLASEQPLATLMYEALGFQDWIDIMPVIYGGGATKLASFAPVVAKAALQGDKAAIHILQTAGEELARLGNVILARVSQSLPVAFAGGISQLSVVLTERLETSLNQATEFSTVEAEPVVTAAKLALKKVSQSTA